MSPDSSPYLPRPFPLDSVAIAMVAELREQMKPAQIALQTVLAYFARQHGLAEGNWQLAENGRELIRTAGAPSRAEAFSRADTCNGAAGAPLSEDTAATIVPEP